MPSKPETSFPPPPFSPTEFMTRYRWVICGLLFFATTINYIDRQVLALLKEPLDLEMKWTNAEFGLVNVFFQGAYAVGLLFFGWFVDRFGAKMGYAISITGWSLAACAHGLVGSITGFKIVRLGLGLSESGNFPSAIKATTQWFPKKERAYATAIFNAGANAGPIIAPLTIPFIAAKWGWRSAFVLAGAVGFIWLVAWLIFYDSPERQRRANAAELAYIRGDMEEKNLQKKLPWSRLLEYRQTWSFIVGKALTDPVWWFFLTWLPDYFNKTRGLDIKKSWAHLATIYAICTVLSILGGWLTGHLIRRGWTVSRARKTGMLIFAFSVLPIMAVTGVGDWTAVLLIGLATASHQAWSANLYTTVSDMFPKRAVASVVGIGGMAGSITGLAFPYFTGVLLDKFEARGNPTAGYEILFVICGSAYLIAFILHHLLAPRFEPIDLEGLEDERMSAPSA